MKESYISRNFLKIVGISAAVLFVGLYFHLAGHNATSKPNIIFFLVDDMGWMDSSVYGSKYYKTPNMERLAKQSMVFTHAYAANPLCSPTRASIMTGKYPARLKFTSALGHLPELGREPTVQPSPPDKRTMTVESRRHLPLKEYTIAEALKEQGYKTCFIGKWHMGKDDKYWPTNQGFDVNIGGTGAPGPPGGYFDPYKNPRLRNRKKGEYITDRITDEALTYIEKNKEGPFFLCMWQYAVHGPWGHKEEITKRLRGNIDSRGKQNNPVMASMLYSVDESLGAIMDKLDELDITDNTIIIFMSDNGGNIHRIVEGKPATNNAPLRGGKGTIYEGGTREPMIVRWPGVVKPGSKSFEIVSSIDFYRTILEMAGIRPKKDQIIDGVSIVPLLTGVKTLDRKAIFCHFPHYTPRGSGNHPATYVRQGNWKLIRFYGRSKKASNEYELYNLKNDIGETINLVMAMPGRVKKLDALIDQHLKDTGALVPIPNPDYDPNSLVNLSPKPKRSLNSQKNDYED